MAREDDLSATSEILAGKTAYIGGNLVTGTMPAFTQQYDSTKTDAENTANAGLTWSSDGSVLTISEGYHTQQQVNSHSGAPTLVKRRSVIWSIFYEYNNERWK